MTVNVKSNPGSKIDARRRPSVVIQYKMSSTITFSLTTRCEFGIDEFRVEFDRLLKQGAADADVPYKTEEEQLSYDTLMWDRVCDEVGEEYDLNENGDDEDELDSTTAGCCISNTVKQVMEEYAEEERALKKAKQIVAVMEKHGFKPKTVSNIPANKEARAALKAQRDAAMKERDAIQARMDAIDKALWEEEE